MNQNCSTYLKSHLEYFLFIIIILLAICIRYQISFRGYNPDVVSYQIVSNLINEGKNVYANTNRYNYGPIWFYILYIIDQISTLFNSNYLSFRHLIALFLAFVDVGISIILIYYKRPKAAIFFLFSPISIIITGYHSQFSNLAILVALSSSLILKKFNIDTIIKSLSYAIFLIFAIYLYLSVSSSNPYINREIPEYANYRTAGPYLIPLLIFQLLHLLTNLPKDKFYWFYTIISILTMVINGGLQNLVILIIGVILNNAPIFFKIKGIKYYIILIPIALAISQYIPDKQANKISELANPLNSQTVLTRISDLTYMLTYNKNKSSLIGDGFGVRSNVFRIVNGQ